MSRHIFSMAALFAAGVLTLACGKPVSDNPWNDAWNVPEAPSEEPVEYPVLPETALSAFADPVADQNWKDVTADYSIREGIKLYSYTDSLFGRPALAYIAVADVKDADWALRSINDPQLEGCEDPLETPSTVYEATKASVIVNGGYFYADGGKNYSASLVVNEGTVLGVNVNYASEDWVSIYYPTRAAFVEHADGKFEACWTYYTSGGAHYLYQNPAQNSWSEKPLAIPSATFPEEAAEFEAKNAIGGGPVLIKDSKIIDSYVYEMFDGSASGVGPTGRCQRTAIGISADNKLVLFICQGRNVVEGVAGLTTEEVAKVLYSLGCKEAVNLDGGGSTCMIAGGKALIEPQGGAQRAVASTVMFK